jgi:hypothetical protein
MFGWQKTDPELEEAIAECLAEMKGCNADSEEYKLLLDSLERLHALRPEKGHKSISRDTLATVMGNLLGILIIVSYERGHVMVSKAKDYVMRPH